MHACVCSFAWRCIYTRLHVYASVLHAAYYSCYLRDICCNDGINFLHTGTSTNGRSSIRTAQHSGHGSQNHSRHHPDIIEAKTAYAFAMIGLTMDLPLACMQYGCNCGWSGNKYSTSVGNTVWFSSSGGSCITFISSA
jgi:hypothetical protein